MYFKLLNIFWSQYSFQIITYGLLRFATRIAQIRHQNYSNSSPEFSPSPLCFESWISRGISRALAEGYGIWLPVAQTCLAIQAAVYSTHRRVFSASTLLRPQLCTVVTCRSYQCSVRGSVRVFRSLLSGTIHVSFWQSDVITSHICCDLSWYQTLFFGQPLPSPAQLSPTLLS